MNYFEHIHLTDWRQFSNVRVDLSQQATILTGQNGSGKTTILNTLSRHFGWNLHFVSTPFWGKRKTQQFWSDVRKSRFLELDDDSNEQAVVGSIGYDSGANCSLLTQKLVSAQYQLTYDGQQPVVGLHIPSHRPPAVYHSVNEIPTNPATAQKHYQDFQQLLAQTYGSSNRVQNPGIAQKKSIISLALFGYGNQAVQANPEYLRIFEEFQEILRHVLPSDLGFERLEVRMPEVVLVTKSGDFALDSMSGGINALFGMAWQIHMYGATTEKCTVTIDEPENHLHPSMQRSILPSLTKAFPRYRFIVATHSPFIVSSFPEAFVYGLVFGEDNRISSEKLDLADLSGTPNRILKEILDVPSNLPIWVENRIEEVLRQNPGLEPKMRARKIMSALRELGLADVVPEMNWEDNDA